MSRIPLRDTEPTLQQAHAQVQVDRAAVIAARNVRDTNKTSWETMSCNPNLSEPAINAARQTLQQATTNLDNAQHACNQSLEDCGNAQDRLGARQDYLQTQKDKRDPLKQVESFPKACNIDLPALMSHLSEEWNAICSDVESGQQFWRFDPPAAYPANDALTRTTVHRQRSKNNINLRRWALCPEAFAAVCTSLDDAGCSVSRHTQP